MEKTVKTITAPRFVGAIPVRVCEHLFFKGHAFNIFDNRVSAEPHEFVRVMFSNKMHLDIPTDDGTEMLGLANKIAGLIGTVSKKQYHDEVVRLVLEYLAQYGTIAVQTCFSPDAWLVRANNSKLSEEGQSLIARAISYTKNVSI